MLATSGAMKNDGARWRSWIVRGALAVALVVVIGFGWSTVFRAGPYVGVNGRHWSRLMSPEQKTLLDDRSSVIWTQREWGAHKQLTDYTVYSLAGHAVLDGTNIYDVRSGGDGWAYVYPPPFAALMVPFAWLPVFWGALAWYLVSVALVASASLMCVRLVQRKLGGASDPFVLCAVPLAVLGCWFVAGMTRGQASVLLMWFVVAAFYWHGMKRDLLGGAALAGAILLKVFPLAMLAYFVWRRQWKFVGATLAALMVMALLLPAVSYGWKQNVTYLREWTLSIAKPLLGKAEERQGHELNAQLFDPSHRRNQSLFAVLSRVTGNATLAKPLALGLGMGMALVLWWIGRRSPPEAETEWVLISAGIVWTLLMPPVAESHYFVMLILPLAVLTHLACRDRDAAVRRLSGWAVGLYGATCLITVAWKSIQPAGPLCWATVGLWCVFMWIVARRSRTQSGKSGVTT